MSFSQDVTSLSFTRRVPSFSLTQGVSFCVLYQHVCLLRPSYNPCTIFVLHTVVFFLSFIPVKFLLSSSHSPYLLFLLHTGGVPSLSFSKTYNLPVFHTRRILSLSSSQDVFPSYHKRRVPFLVFTQGLSSLCPSHRSCLLFIFHVGFLPFCPLHRQKTLIVAYSSSPLSPSHKTSLLFVIQSVYLPCLAHDVSPHCPSHLTCRVIVLQKGRVSSLSFAPDVFPRSP